MRDVLARNSSGSSSLVPMRCLSMLSRAALRSPRDVCYLAHEPRRAWSQGPDGPVQDATDDVLDAFLDLCCDLDVSEVGKTGNVQLYRIARP